MGAGRVALIGQIDGDGEMATRTVPVADDLLALLFAETRALTLRLTASLSDADATVQSMPDASPAKWHLAHTTWFFETFVLRDFVPDYEPFDAGYHYLYNSYYEGEGERHARDRRGMITRPALDDVRRYRAHVDAAVTDAFASLTPDARTLIELGCHHEAQHQELLLTDILHLFAQNPIKPALWAPRPSPLASVAPSPTWVTGPSGRVEIGHDGRDFAFDCERPRHSAWLAPFAIADRLVTNGEWQAFIADGGYAQPALWLADGWAWTQANAIKAPLYWNGDAVFGLHGMQSIDPLAPVVHVSFYEADAYARWVGARLPTEAEWEAIAALDMPGLRQLFGAVWQWTGSAFLPYPGFSVADGVVGEYNGKFMSGQMVLRGGSSATPPGTSRLTTRNFFPPTARWQFSGLRLARDL